MTHPLLRNATRFVLLAACALSLAGEARARSALILPAPDVWGIVPATAYDTTGKRIGGADISIERGENGRVTMRAATAIDDGARTEVEAVLEVIDGGPNLRLLSQKSQSFDAQGHSYGILYLDHTKRIGSCTPRGGMAEDALTLELPEDDRIANIPLNLLFLPLVEKKVEHIDFQVFLCRNGPRLIDFKTETERRGDVVEIRYKPVLSRMISWFAESFLLPSLAFWFDVNQQGLYVAHRMPLYPEGPEVLIVRDGTSPAELQSPLAAVP